MIKPHAMTQVPSTWCRHQLASLSDEQKPHPAHDPFLYSCGHKRPLILGPLFSVSGSFPLFPSLWLIIFDQSLSLASTQRYPSSPVVFSSYTPSSCYLPLLVNMADPMASTSTACQWLMHLLLYLSLLQNFKPTVLATMRDTPQVSQLNIVKWNSSTFLQTCSSCLPSTDFQFTLSHISLPTPSCWSYLRNISQSFSPSLPHAVLRDLCWSTCPEWRISAPPFLPQNSVV